MILSQVSISESYQDNMGEGGGGEVRGVRMKGCVQCLLQWERLPPAGLELGTARSAGHAAFDILNYWGS